MNKKIFWSVLLAVILFSSFGGFLVQAQEPTGAPKIDLIEGIKRVIDLIFIIIFFVAIIFMLLAGYDFIFVSSDPTKAKAVKDQVFWAAVGLGIAILAWGIVQFIYKKITGT